MEALINEIVARTGMTREMAAEAAKLTADYIKARVSTQARAEIDGVFIGQSVGETVSDIAGRIESTFRR
ncbi:MAG TPA: hypothetical protein PLJ35_16830 [Anaerolineae bacterium]|nr:hypothetical protein [Anaerolineae bacterium]HOR00478.1 hypothetical protein [Anaerolineae bacterium]HPL28364.1 hypothetical protein [Anaerolineae bacterium]